MSVHVITMGFGLCTIGAGALIAYIAGGGVIGALLLAYGFFHLLRYKKGFLVSLVAAACMLPHSVVLTLITFGVMQESTSAMYTASYVFFNISWMVMIISAFLCVKHIAQESGAEKIAGQASLRIGINAFYFGGAVLLIILQKLFPDIFKSDIFAFFFILQYIVIIIDALFFHSCYVLITTEKRLPDDMKRYNEEMSRIQSARDLRLEKKHKK